MDILLNRIQGNAKKMTLKEILKNIVPESELKNINPKILEVTSDSRKVKPGFLFVAYKGVDVDGHSFINKAIINGAVAVVGEEKLALSVPYFRVKNGRLAWAMMMANYYGNPEKQLTIIGVTGTDGKTTTTNLLYNFLKAAGTKVSMVSTIKAIIGGREFDTGLHTSSPDPDILWSWLSEAVKQGDTHIILETTSHGLAQYRFGDITFDIGVLTNLAHDHLEFHQTIKGYRSAKALLFEKSKLSILNQTSKEYKFFKSKAAGKVEPYNVKSEIKNIKYEAKDSSVTQTFDLLANGTWHTLTTHLPGEYNLENILAAAKTALSLGVDITTISKVLKNFKNLPGRFQTVPNRRNLHAIVDFAHTEQGIRSVLTLVRRNLIKDNARLIAVFGCNGGRDQTKRAPMGKAACELADLVVVTTEDPRNESIDQIYTQIAQGCLEAGGVLNKTFFRVDDRKEAIGFAINKLAKSGDWILFLGKGHEQSMNLNGIETPWDETQTIKEIIRKTNGRKG